ncbi:MAG: Nif3-like dinuclear metal center hexameric protein [Firmicutes bacterium]|nr:Nif3-like dinuclear metal center hexameric protein [Candidatus Colivicinus equi]
MLISEIIQKVKSECSGKWKDYVIEESTTRDKILYGNPNQECTGIVVTLFASVDVIKRAKELGANFIIVHEALFWNHGDHTDWLVDNETYKQKVELLGDICVWRNHDYIHSGIMIDGQYVDGIFTGLMHELGWEKYLTKELKYPREYTIDEKPVKELCDELMDKLHLNGIKCAGDMNGTCKKIMFPMHLIGQIDNDVTKYVEENDIDTLICMEATDFTTSEYIRDSAMLGRNKRILAVGHFNVEEPGMKWFAEHMKEYIDVNIEFVRSGDAYSFVKNVH